MNNWGYGILGDFAQIISGKNYTKSRVDYVDNNEYLPYYRVSDLTEKGTNVPLYSVPRRLIKESDIVPKNSVLLSTVGTIGNVCITNEDSVINTNLKAIIPHESIKSEYLELFLYCIKDQLLKITPASSRKNLSAFMISNLNFVYPKEVDRQIKFVGRYNMLYDIRSSRNYTIEKIDQVLKSYIDLLCIQSESEVMLKELLSEKIEAGEKISKNDVGKTEVGIARISNTGIFNLNKNVRTEKIKLSSARKLLFNDIIISKSLKNGFIGNFLIVRDYDIDVIHDSNAVKLSTNEDKLYPEVLFLFLNSSYIQSYVKRAQRPSVKSSLRNMTLYDMPIPDMILKKQLKLKKVFMLYEILVNDIDISITQVNKLLFILESELKYMIQKKSNEKSVANKPVGDQTSEGDIKDFQVNGKKYFGEEKLPTMVTDSIIDAEFLLKIPTEERYMLDISYTKEKFGNLYFKSFKTSSDKKSILVEGFVPHIKESYEKKTLDCLELESDDFIYEIKELIKIPITSIEQLKETIKLKENEVYFTRFDLFKNAQKKFIESLSVKQKQYFEIFLLSPKPLAIHEAFKLFLLRFGYSKANESLQHCINTIELIHRHGLIEEVDTLFLTYSGNSTQSDDIVKVFDTELGVKRWKSIRGAI